MFDGLYQIEERSEELAQDSRTPTYKIASFLLEAKQTFPQAPSILMQPSGSINASTEEGFLPITPCL